MLMLLRFELSDDRRYFFNDLDRWASCVTEACRTARLAFLEANGPRKKKARPVLMLAGGAAACFSSLVFSDFSPSLACFKNGCSTTEFGSCLLALWTSCFASLVILLLISHTTRRL